MTTTSRKRNESAGTVLYRLRGVEPEILLVHPSGAYNRSMPWSIPKGLPEEGESLEAAARRETLEETGVRVEAPLVSLGYVAYRSGKRVHAFAGPAPDNAQPACASWEVDRAQFMPCSEAKLILQEAQREFVSRLETYLTTVMHPQT